MANILANSFVNTIVDTPQVVYTAPSSGSTTISSFTVANNSTVNASYKAYITDSITTDKKIIPFKVVVWGENDLGLGLVNQVIPAGGALRVESSALNSIYFTVSGIES